MLQELGAVAQPAYEAASRAAETVDTETALNAGLAAYGTFWTVLNAYNFYPMARSWLAGDGQDGAEDIDALYDEVREDPPEIDVFIPAYEEDVIDLPLRSTDDAAYPEDALNRYVLLEPGDERTRRRLDDIEDDVDFDVLTVPSEYPGEPNKPRALNYGFTQTDGDIVGVLDAEDIVAEELFKEVAAKVGGDDGADYAQGILDMANEDDGWRSAMFRGEYGHWYRHVLPAYHHAGYPTPLGGTTNFIDREVLDEVASYREERFGSVWSEEQRAALDELDVDAVAPWNPDNVTEDYELGLLLWEEGYDMTLLDAVTREESPPTASSWLQQRTRWQRGKLETLSQFREHPPETRREMAHIYAQSLVPRLGPINTAGVGLSAAAVATSTPLGPVTSALMGAGAAAAASYGALQAKGYLSATDYEPDESGVWPQEMKTHNAANLLTLPVYWAHQWAADFRALWQIRNGDSAWEKTEHHAAHDE